MIAQKIERWGQELWQQGVVEGEARGLRKGEARGLRKGEARGLRKGEARGLRKGEALALLRLLERRFGGLPPRLQKRVEGADLDSLQRWLDRTLTAESLEQVFAD